jgi:hypothetical protein
MLGEVLSFAMVVSLVSGYLIEYSPPLVLSLIRRMKGGESSSGGDLNRREQRELRRKEGIISVMSFSKSI